MTVSGVSGFRMMAIMMGFLAVALPVQAEVKKPQPADDKVALVNGASIDRGEFDGEVLMIQKTLLGYGKPLTPNQIASVRTDVLESMIRREILYQESPLGTMMTPDDLMAFVRGQVDDGKLEGLLIFSGTVPVT